MRCIRVPESVQACIDGLFHTVEILDTAGSHHFPAMRELSIRSGRGFVLVFAVDSLQSFHEAVQLWHLIAKIRAVGEREGGELRVRSSSADYNADAAGHRPDQEMFRI
ncbi:hypothetical protein HPB47_019329 [Ixodes persulcatus]|uniref:Uncharacterized protein n=1 Tax=Ixodes persulcatus TaxID=34615 RepID=A0AC60QJB8_IXOPE|nr:hypothetical protein HPB47_019329 [Ixodes persulcatus]